MDEGRHRPRPPPGLLLAGSREDTPNAAADLCRKVEPEAGTKRRTKATLWTLTQKRAGELKARGFQPLPYDLGVKRTLADWQSHIQICYPLEITTDHPETIRLLTEHREAHQKAETAGVVYHRMRALGDSITLGELADAGKLGMGDDMIRLTQIAAKIRTTAEKMRTEGREASHDCMNSYRNLVHEWTVRG